MELLHPVIDWFLGPPCSNRYKKLRANRTCEQTRVSSLTERSEVCGAHGGGSRSNPFIGSEERSGFYISRSGRDLESFHLMKLVDLDDVFFFGGGGGGRILDKDRIFFVFFLNAHLVNEIEESLEYIKWEFRIATYEHSTMMWFFGRVAGCSWWRVVLSNKDNKPTWQIDTHISLSQWLNFKLFGITYLVGKIKFKLFFSGSTGWVRYNHVSSMYGRFTYTWIP